MLTEIKIKNFEYLKKREEVFSSLKDLPLPSERYTDLRNIPFGDYLKVKEDILIRDELSDLDGILLFPDFLDNKVAYDLFLKVFELKKDRLIATHFIFPTGGFFLELNNREKKFDLSSVSPLNSTYSFQTYIFKLNSSYLELKINQENEGNFFSHNLFIFLLDDSSKLKLYNFHNSNISYLFNSLFLFLGRDSETEIFSAYFRNPYSKVDKYIFVEGEGAKALVKDVFVGEKKNFLSLRNDLIFRKSYTSGEEYSRGILFDESTVCFYGLARVEENLKKINAFVEGDALLLSSSASFLPVPSLEILSNDLRCTHSVNSGPLSEEKLFYMISRGLSREEAVRMYVESYLLSNLDGAEEGFKERVKDYLSLIKV
ncbi:MAG: SufD family Fe-S cluster assembly protein [candidate division WOR-3 bacterium]